MSVGLGFDKKNMVELDVLKSSPEHFVFVDSYKYF